MRRTVPRLPSHANWALRSALHVTRTDGERIEKQLEKSIAAACKNEGWGNAVSTASGLISSGGRQMNIDLVHRIPNGFGFIELKWKTDDPVLAATQLMRYAALYMLYRLEPELMAALPANEMLRAPHVKFEVLAPQPYYFSRFDLLAFQGRVQQELHAFCSSHIPDLTAEFAHRAFPCNFHFVPGMASEHVRSAVLNRASPFLQIVTQPGALLKQHPPSQQIRMRGCSGETVASLADWQVYGLPEERRHHWKLGRSACELATSWSRQGTIQIPREVEAMLAGHVETHGHHLDTGHIEHETALPYSTKGPRCHDLLLTGSSIAGSPIVLSIEAKADEPFDAPVWKKLAAVRGRHSNIPARLEWFTQYLFGESAFLDSETGTLKKVYRDMPYQLMAAVAGICLEAELHSSRQAIFIVHEFQTFLTDPVKMELNAVALGAFFKHLAIRNSFSKTSIPNGSLAGPVEMRSGSFNGVPFPSHIQLLIGKIRTDTTTTMALDQGA